MAEIYIYRPDCQDFSTIGECGRLTPSRYEWDGAANSLPEIVLEHPLDPMGRYALLQEGWIIKAPAPVRLMPEIENGSYVTSVQRWTVASTASKAQRYVYSKHSGGRKKKLLKAGWSVVVTSVPANAQRWKIKCGRATGWIDPDALTDRTDVTIPDTAMGIEDVAPSWESRDQLFRIYDVNKTGQKITVYARAKAGDAAGNVTTYDVSGAVSLQTALDGVIANTLDACALTAATDINGTRTGVHARDLNPISAILNPEDGLAARWNAQVVFDDEDLYLLASAGADRGVRIEYARNLEGVDMDVNIDDVITHVRPVGETKNGGPLYLAENSGLVACPNAGNYPFKRIYVLDVSDAKVKDGVSTALARQRLRQAANDLIDTGVDVPSVNAKISFDSLGNSRMFAQYKRLQGVFLYDTVTIWHPRLNINMATTICRIKWDGLRDKVIDTEIGDLADMSPTVSSWQISGKINGSRLIPNTVGAGQLADEAVSARHVQAESINTDALQARSITAEKLAVGAVYAQALEAVQAHIQQLAAGRITTDELYASLAQIAAAEVGEADIEHADVKALAAAVAAIAEAQIEHADIETAVIQDAQVQALAAALARITRADIETAALENALIDWAGIDNLTAQAAAIAKANVGTAAISSANVGWAAIQEISAQLADIAQARIDQAAISQAQIDALHAEVTDTLTLTAQNANFDFASAQRLVASAMILDQGVGGSVTIENLAATSAMFVQATLGGLTLKGDDGDYYDVTVTADGALHTQRVEPTAAEIAAGQMANGRKIVETEADIAELNAGNIRAQSAVVAEIFTTALTAEKISASEAFMASATVPELYVTALKAIGDTLDISANQGVRIVVGNAVADAVPGAVDEAVTEAMVEATPAVLRIDSSRGTVFKDGAVSTVLSVAIHYGGQVIEDANAMHAAFGNSAYLQWEWLRLDDDRYGVISAGDSRLSGGGFQLTLSPEDVDTKVTFRCSLITE